LNFLFLEPFLTFWLYKMLDTYQYGSCILHSAISPMNFSSFLLRNHIKNQDVSSRRAHCCWVSFLLGFLGWQCKEIHVCMFNMCVCVHISAILIPTTICIHGWVDGWMDGYLDKHEFIVMFLTPIPYHMDHSTFFLLLTITFHSIGEKPGSDRPIFVYRIVQFRWSCSIYPD
jgi:hypothetical protein